MPAFFLYLFKLSIALAAVYLLYRVLLQRHTFYRANRCYLLLCMALCPLIAWIDVSPFVAANNGTIGPMTHYVPMVQQLVAEQAVESPAPAIVQTANGPINPWAIAGGLVWAGMLFSLIRFLLKLASLMRIRKRSVPIGNHGAKLFQVPGNPLPFSFGNGIYLNPTAYSPSELDKIIRHEQVHVIQRHTIDILLAELLCIVNWCNPFAWWLRHAVRQNLEFIADDAVAGHGSDKKDYQYLLLKVSGTPVFGLANHLNFSSLKKRIVMMNKIKSAKVHLLKLALLLPLTALLLLAFRQQHPAANGPVFHAVGMVVDGTTFAPLKGVLVKEEFSGKTAVTDEMGYYDIPIAVTDKRIPHRCFYTAKDYGVAMVDRIALLTNLSAATGSFSFCGLVKGDAADRSKFPIAFNTSPDYVSNPSRETLLQIYEQQKAAILEERQAAATKQPFPSSDAADKAAAIRQQLFNESDKPYHYLDGVHYLVGSNSGAWAIVGDEMMIEVDGQLHTAKTLAQKFTKHQMGATLAMRDATAEEKAAYGVSRIFVAGAKNK
jgi:hypothetical protein